MVKQSKKGEGAKFVRFFGPVLDALRELGDSGTPLEVVRKVAANLNISEDEQNAPLKSGSQDLPTRLHGHAII